MGRTVISTAFRAAIRAFGPVASAAWKSLSGQYARAKMSSILTTSACGFAAHIKSCMRRMVGHVYYLQSNTPGTKSMVRRIAIWVGMVTIFISALRIDDLNFLYR